jgi:rod shape determining protein RodA
MESAAVNGNFDRSISNEDVLHRRSSLLQRLHIDGMLLLLLLVLACGSLFILYSASGKNWDLLLKQASSFGIGLAAMLVIAQFDPRFMARWVPLAYGVGVALLVAVELVGHTAMGATRWINIPGLIRFQPSELMKIVMPMTIAWYLSNRNLPPRFKHIAISLTMIMVPVVLIMKQPDLGTSLLILASGVFVLFVAGLRWRWIIGAVAAAVPIAVAMWFFVMHDYQKRRVLTFLDPERDPLGSGWNIIQSKAAIGSGGVFGKGWLMGTQSHLDFLPESHTDFIIAVLGEEFGLVGICLLLLVYMLLIGRGLVITVQAQTLFGKLLAGSLTMTFFVYVFVNIGMVSGLLPVVGVPLPFISYGGTSLVTLLSGFGILMAIQTHRKWITQV